MMNVWLLSNLLQDASPNGWAALIAVIGFLGPMGMTLLTHFLGKRNAKKAAAQVKGELHERADEQRAHLTAQDEKLDTIQQTVNGESHAKDKRIARLEAQLRAAGLEPE